jgi:hypothetical protein
MTTNEAEALEALVDRYGLSAVISQLANVCDDKSQHIASNWQDNVTARMWMNCVHILDRASDRVKTYLPA